MRNSPLKYLFIAFQHLVPQHLLSRLVGWLADSEVTWIKNRFIQFFLRNYDINMEEAAESNPWVYPTFNAFFTRALKPGARPLEGDEKTLVSPADGAISEIGNISSDRIFQAKGKSYSATTLLGGDSALAQQFDGGKFATVYLSPRDYHRVHMPLTGTLNKMLYVPGDLFSVNNTTAENVDNLFARNERLVAVFDTEIGPVAMVLVGAMIVAGIETVWDGQVTPLPKQVKTTDYSNRTVTLEKGQEMGRFKLGSTVILCLPKDSGEWLSTLSAGTPLKMGQAMGELTIS